MASKFQFITELYRATLAELTGDYESWTGFLRAACYNYKCPFDEQVLIYAQRPNATAVLELRSGTGSLAGGSMPGLPALLSLTKPTVRGG